MLRDGGDGRVAVAARHIDAVGLGHHRPSPDILDIPIIHIVLSGRFLSISYRTVRALYQNSTDVFLNPVVLTVDRSKLKRHNDLLVIVTHIIWKMSNSETLRSRGAKMLHNRNPFEKCFQGQVCWCLQGTSCTPVGLPHPGRSTMNAAKPDFCIMSQNQHRHH